MTTFECICDDEDADRYYGQGQRSFYRDYDRDVNKPRWAMPFYCTSCGRKSDVCVECRQPIPDYSYETDPLLCRMSNGSGAVCRKAANHINDPDDLFHQAAGSFWLGGSDCICEYAHTLKPGPIQDGDEIGVLTINDHCPVHRKEPT